MSNVSGVSDNKVFRTGINPKEPYYYIHAHLDLSGAEVGGPGNNYVYYFNTENNFNYLNYLGGADEYPGFYPIEDNAVIDEVVVYSGPDLKYSFGGGDISDLNFDIGGAYTPSIAKLAPSPLDVWGGVTGNVAGSIPGNLLTDAQICRYGKEPQFPSDFNNKPSLARKFLAVNITQGQRSVNASNEAQTSLGQIRIGQRVIKGKNGKPKVVRQVLPEDVIESGTLYVVVKVLVKFY